MFSSQVLLGFRVPIYSDLLSFIEINWFVVSNNRQSEKHSVGDKVRNTLLDFLSKISWPKVKNTRTIYHSWLHCIELGVGIGWLELYLSRVLAF
jgi:hypothetical protein